MPLVFGSIWNATGPTKSDVTGRVWNSDKPCPLASFGSAVISDARNTYYMPAPILPDQLAFVGRIVSHAISRETASALFALTHISFRYHIVDIISLRSVPHL